MRKAIYIAEFLLWYSKFYINNKATDQELDVLYIPYSISSIEIANISNSLKLKITNQEKNSIKIVDVLDYFKGAEYQHLMLLDEEYNGFIPFNTPKTGLILAPFYRASNTKNVFLVSSDTKLAVIEDTNYEIYRKDYDLIFLTTNKFIGLQASIVLKDFYSDHESWKNFKFYKYNKAIDYKNPIELPHINQGILTLDHKNLNSPDIFIVYNVDFTDDEEIFHNIEDIYTDSHPTPEENKKIGIVRFWNINPKDITVERQNEDMVLKHVNGYELIISKVYSDTYASHIDIFEFWGLEELLEPIIIYHNSNYSFQFQLLQVAMIYEAYIHINKLGNKADCLDINELKYLIALENIKDVSTAKALGFASLLEQMQYLQNYNLISNDLIKLKDCINDKLLSQYEFILHESLPLKPISKEKVAEYREIIEQIPSNSASIIKFIDNLIQEVNNTSSRTARHINHNNYHKTEFNVDEANYHAEFLTSGASKSGSFINNIIGSIREGINSIANIYGSEQQPQNNIFVGEKYVSLNENNIASLSNSFIVPEDNGWKQYNFYQGCPDIDSPFKQHIVSNIEGQNEVNMVIRSHSFGSCANVYHNTHIKELPTWARVCKKPKNLAEILSLPYDSNNHISALNQNASTIIQIGNGCEIIKSTFGFLGNDNPSLKVIIPVTGTVVYVASLLPSVNLYNLPIHLIPSILSSIKDYMEDKSYMKGVIIAGKVAIVGLSAVNPLTQLAFSAYTIGSVIYSKLPQDSGTKLTIASGGAVAIIHSDISSIVDVSKEIVDINKGLNNLQFVSTALNTCKMVFPYLKSLYNKITKTDNVSEDLWADGLCNLIKNIQKFPLSSQDQNSLNEISKNLPTELPEIKTTWTELLEIKDRYEKAQHDELEVLGDCILV